MNTNVVRRWVITVIICALIIPANSALQPLIDGKSPFSLYYPALVVIGLIGGAGPSIFALTIFILTAFYFWTIPFDRAIAISLLIFLITGAMVVGIASFVRIVLLRDRATRDALKSARERLDMAHVAAKMVEWHWDLKSGHLEYSNSAREIFGAHWTQAGEGMMVAHADDKDMIEAIIARALAHDNGYSFTSRMIRPDNRKEIWVETRAVIYRNAEREATHVTGVTFDITEKKNVLAALEMSQRRFEVALQGSSIIAWSCDAEKKYDWVYNPAQPISAEEIIGKPIASIYPRDTYSDYAEALERVWQTGIAETLPVTWTHLGRTRHYVSNIAPILQANGKIAGMIGASVDVTALHEAQQALREADRQKDEFIATLAHELRNPMAPIRYAAALIGADAGAATLQNAREVIERQSRHMSRLLDDLLDMSRITRNVIELKFEELDMRALINEAVEAARPTIEAQNHAIVISVPHQPAPVRGDAVRLVQVIGNLLNNAIKYTPSGGRLELALSISDGDIVLAVTDNGVGLAPDMLPDVFRLFGQAHKSLKVSSGGLGIGLAVAKRLVELHGGTLEAKSDGLGRGATFIMRLPKIVSLIEPAPPAHAKVKTLFANSRTLVVDDNKDAADTLAGLLRAHGITVHVAYDGKSALAVARAVQPNAVVLDLGLPDISGEEVAAEFRRQDWSAGAKIIAVTGWGQEADRERTKRAGFDSHLVKPVDPQELIDMLYALSGEKYIAAND